MTPARDPISEVDLDAYVDDQLAVDRRIAVEAHLATHPETAARVMTDLRMRNELRLALGGQPEVVSPRTNEAARKLERAIGRSHRLRQLPRIAALGLVLCVAWLAHAHIGGIGAVNATVSTPAHVTEALTTFRAQKDRLPAKVAEPYRPADIRAMTAIALPELPEGWSVRGTEIVPSRFGPSIELTLDADRIGRAALFAVRPGTFDVVPATAVHDGESAAYWQIGDVAYVLVAQTDAKDLELIARDLAATLY